MTENLTTIDPATVMPSYELDRLIAVEWMGWDSPDTPLWFHPTSNVQNAVVALGIAGAWYVRNINNEDGSFGVHCTIYAKGDKVVNHQQKATCGEANCLSEVFALAICRTILTAIQYRKECKAKPLHTDHIKKQIKAINVLLNGLMKSIEEAS